MSKKSKVELAELKRTNPKKYRRIKLLGYGVWALVAIFILNVAFGGEDSAPVVEKEKPVVAKEEKKAPSIETRIKDALSSDDEFEFTESTGALFVRARAVSDDRENVAKEKLYRVVEALQPIKEIETLNINVQGPSSSPLLIKYRIRGEKLRDIDFGISGYDNVLNAADKLSGKFAN